MSNGGSYDPHAVEGEIYRFWEEGGYFHAEPNPNKRPYVIDIPLPNVTGALHLGHALNNTLQDILIRQKRMAGFAAMWMPGTDHAGIATQAVVEKKLKEDQNLSRHELGREGLVKKIWEWKEEYGGRILMQLRKMGFSCDWPRTRFTLDDVCARAVYEVFFQWFKDGLIYRGTRLVNWDAHLQTAVADDEIFHETVQGHMWHYRYPILTGEEVQGAGIGDQGSACRAATVSERPMQGSAVAAGLSPGRSLPEDVVGAALARATHKGAKTGRDYLSIATTRPETMLGDTAIAVHPGDKRYKHLIGRRVLLPLQNRAIPVIGDDILVQPEFGTGCVKVTPGHDPNDYECGQRHGLRFINILTPDGKINENGGAYVGMDRYAAREKVVEDLTQLGLLEKIEDYETEVGHSDRSKTPIEPMLSEQWFMKMGALAELAMDAVRDGRVQFFPQRYEKTYLDWLGEKRDWCISRQLWWGHRIPVWTLTLKADLYRAEEKSLRASLDRVRAQFLSAVDKFAIACGVQGHFAAIQSEKSETIFHVCGRTAEACRELESFWQRHHRARHTGPFDTDPLVEPRLQEGDPRNAADRAMWQTIALMNKRDEDVLDTWFSSALWPFSTLGWPHEEQAQRHEGTEARSETPPGPPSVPACLRASVPSPADLDYFYPTSTLVTARGIITLWVARMVMTGLYFTQRVPFQHVHIHPIIQDGLGRTMSKSLGNGVDPLDIIQLYGTDALRFTMAQMDTETQDVRMPVKPVKLPDGRTVNSSEKFELARNFCNKVWQAATGFVLPNLICDNQEPRSAGRPSPAPAASDGSLAPDSEVRRYTPRPLTAKDLALEDHWILSRLAATIAEVDRRLGRYQISEVANTLYSFFWSDFCDWYVELVKPRLFGGDAAGAPNRPTDESAQVARQVLAWVLDQSLRLLHPITPFVTEALWKQLNAAAPRRGIGELVEGEPAVIKAAWPEAGAWTREPAVEAQMEVLQSVIRVLRDKRTFLNTHRPADLPAVRELPRGVIRTNAVSQGLLEHREGLIGRLGQCQQVEIGPEVSRPPAALPEVLPNVEVFVPLPSDDPQYLAAFCEKLKRECQRLRGAIGSSEARLSNEGFLANAPQEVVAAHREQLAINQELLRKRAAILEELRR